MPATTSWPSSAPASAHTRCPAIRFPRHPAVAVVITGSSRTARMSAPRRRHRAARPHEADIGRTRDAVFGAVREIQRGSLASYLLGLACRSAIRHGSRSAIQGSIANRLGARSARRRCERQPPSPIRGRMTSLHVSTHRGAAETIVWVRRNSRLRRLSSSISATSGCMTPTAMAPDNIAAVTRASSPASPMSTP